MRRIGAALLSLAVFLAIWKVVTVIGDYPEFILPAPELVIERAARAVASGVLWEHTLTTLVEVILGFAVGATAAIVVGIALGKSVVVERVLSPYIVAAQAVPILALAPLLDIWFGGGLTARVTITVTLMSPGNRPPVAVDDTYSVLGAIPTILFVLANDSDPDGDPIEIVSITQPANGVANIVGNGTIRYRSNSGYCGPDTFTYTIRDPSGATSTATVTLDVLD